MYFNWSNIVEMHTVRLHLSQSHENLRLRGLIETELTFPFNASNNSRDKSSESAEEDDEETTSTVYRRSV